GLFIRCSVEPATQHVSAIDPTGCPGRSAALLCCAADPGSYGTPCLGRSRICGAPRAHVHSKLAAGPRRALVLHRVRDKPTTPRRSAPRSGTAPAPAGRRSATCWADRRRPETGAETPACDTP